VCRCVWSRNHKNPREWGAGQGPLGGYRAKRKKVYIVGTANNIVKFLVVFVNDIGEQKSSRDAVISEEGSSGCSGN